MRHRKMCVLPALLVGLGAISSSSYAQSDDALEQLVQSREAEVKELKQLETDIGPAPTEGFLGRVRLPRSEQATERVITQDLPIDPDQYIVGPADVLQLYIWGEFDVSYSLQVDPEGHILIPTVGDFAVGGKSLTEVRDYIFEAAREKYEGVEITLNLSSMRFFTVYIAGAVTHEGNITVHPNTRVSEVLDMAGGFIDELRGDIGEEIAGGKTVTRVRRLEQRPTARRAVKVLHADASVDTVDLTMFYSTGDVRFNPYMLMGDRIHVDFRVNQVQLFGPFFREGIVEYRSNDKISDLITLVGGFRSLEPIEYVEMWRWIGDSQEYSIIPVAGALNSGKPVPLEDFANVPVQASDNIFVRTVHDWQYGETVTIYGEVKYNGKYRIHPGKTRVRDLVQMAGGFTDLAALDLATATSKRYAQLPDPELLRVQQLQLYEALRPEDVAYLHSKTAERPGDIVLDFARLFEEGDESQNILLNGGDEIHVPRKRGVVKATGALKNPGLIAYKPGETLKYYLDLAGGFTRKADKDESRLIRSRTGERISFDEDIVVRESDEIWVPLTPYRNWGEITRTSVDAVAQALTMLVIVTALRN